MNKHRYILEPYKGPNTRYQCPQCKQKEFSRYIDVETGNYIDSSVGRCNRENNCGYQYTPRQYFEETFTYDNSVSVSKHLRGWKQETPPKPVSFISFEIFKNGLRDYENNSFAKFLLTIFDSEIVSSAVEKYFIGTSDYQFSNIAYPDYVSPKGAVIFWQIDSQGKIRTGKIMLYNADTGKRVKQPFNHITWAHKALNLSEFELRQCLFGEHLLKDKTKPIAIVESEKTAVIASVYLPQFIWLAAGSSDGLGLEKCKVLAGRKVVLFPDLNCFEKWNHKAKELSHLANFTVSELLERKASEAERAQGLDLADYLLRFSFKEFKEPEPIVNFPTVLENSFETIEVSGIVKASTNDFELLKGFVKTVKPKVENWQQEISELENLFNTVKLPEVPVKLDSVNTITDIQKFIDSHLSIVKAQNGNKCYLPYLHRLRALKRILAN